MVCCWVLSIYWPLEEKSSPMSALEWHPHVRKLFAHLFALFFRCQEWTWMGHPQPVTPEKCEVIYSSCWELFFRTCGTHSRAETFHSGLSTHFILAETRMLLLLPLLVLGIMYCFSACAGNSSLQLKLITQIVLWWCVLIDIEQKQWNEK